VCVCVFFFHVFFPFYYTILIILFWSLQHYIAAVARRPGEPLVIEEIIVAPPMPREVRIRILCTSLCYVDLAFSNMQVYFFILHNINFFYLLVIHFNWFLKMYFLKCVLKDPPGFFPRILGHEAIGWVSTFCILVIAVMIIICQNFCTHSQHHVQDCNVNCGSCQLQLHHVTLSAI
jgi:hypothetical protein